MAFQKAVKRNLKLRMALCGPSGSGKTYTLLKVAKELGKRVAVADTERRSSELYADEFDFDVQHFNTSTPESLIQFIADAVAGGYDVALVDSLSHFWMGKDGELDRVDQVAKRSQSNNSFDAWRTVTPLHNKLVEALTGSPIHVLVSLRTKTEWVIEKNDKGKNVPRKVGMAPIMRDGIEFEFDVCGDMDQDNTLVVTKTRCKALRETNGGVFAKPGKDVADILKTWLNSGAPAEEQKPEAPKAEAPKPSTPAERKAAMVAQIEAFRTTLGEKLYFQVLGAHGLTEAAEIKDGKAGNALLAELGLMAKSAEGAAA